jgi:hypothetical protein
MPFIDNHFDNGVLTNPGNCCLNAPFSNTYDGNHGSWFGIGSVPFGCPSCPAPDILAVEADYFYTTPIPAISSVRFWNQFGADLGDADGPASFDIEIFNSLNVLIYSGNFVAGNGPAPFTLDVGLLQDVAHVRMFNLVPQIPGATFIGWRELETITPDADCLAATDITFTSATLNAEAFAVADGNFYQWEWGTLPDPELFDKKSPLILTNGSNPNSPNGDPISYSVTGLQPNTTYYYHVCIYDGDGFLNPNTQEVTGAEAYNSNPICSEVCSFTTPDAASWCGGFFLPENCISVDIDGDGNEDYLNCNQF